MSGRAGQGEALYAIANLSRPKIYGVVALLWHLAEAWTADLWFHCSTTSGVFFFPPSILLPLIIQGLLCTVLLGCKPRDSHQEPRSRLVESCACLSSATVEHVPERAMSGGGCDCAGAAVFVRVPVQVQIQMDTGTGTKARGHRDEGREWTVTGVGSQKQMVNKMSMSICKSWCGYVDSERANGDGHWQKKELHGSLDL